MFHVFRVWGRRYARAGRIVDVQLFTPGRVYFVRWRTLAGAILFPDTGSVLVKV